MSQHRKYRHGLVRLAGLLIASAVALGVPMAAEAAGEILVLDHTRLGI